MLPRKFLLCICQYHLAGFDPRNLMMHLSPLLLSNVDEVVRFSGQAQRRQLTYATKQLIGREVSCTCNESFQWCMSLD